MRSSFLGKQIGIWLTSLSGVGLAMLLTACGGSGSSSADAAKTLSITGTTSTGAALAGATLDARCANGTTGSATSAQDGTYTVQISGGTLPCMLRATGTDVNGDPITLHSIADVGTTTTNVTPLTQWILTAATSASGTTPNDAFATFASSTTQSSLSKDKLTDAKQVVANAAAAVATAGGQGVNLTTIDPLSDSFKVGSDNDKIIDALVAALKTNATSAKISEVIASLSNSISTAVKNNPSNVSAAISEASSKAASVVSKPFAIANCPAAQNVRYRIVGVGGGTALTEVSNFGTSSSNLLSGTMVAKWEGDTASETDTVTFDATNPCKFTVQPPGSSLITAAFAPSGIFVAQDAGGASSNAGIGIGFPEQTIALSELAGTWNALEFSKEGSGWGNFQIVFTLDGVGNFSNVQECSGFTASNTCTSAVNPPKTLVANPKGGFDVTTGSTSSDRVFAFRSASGTLMLAVARSNGGLIIATPQTTLTSHPKDFTSVGYFVTASANSGSSSLYTQFHSYTMQITESASDNASQTWLRSLYDGTTDNLSQVDYLNVPRQGLRSRPSVTYTRTGTNSSTTTHATISLPVKGAGFVASISTSATATTPFMTLSVNK